MESWHESDSNQLRAIKLKNNHFPICNHGVTQRSGTIAFFLYFSQLLDTKARLLKQKLVNKKQYLSQSDFTKSKSATWFGVY